jgi:hypothetical protein
MKSLIKMPNQSIAILILSILILTACGPSPEELAATDAETAAATSTQSPTPIPTFTKEPFILELNSEAPLKINGLSVGSFIYGYTVLDINADGLNDLVYSGPVWRDGFVDEQVEITFLLNKGNGRFVHGTDEIFHQLTPSLVHTRDALTADFNGDGIADIYFAGHGYDNQPFPGEENILILSQPDGSYANNSDQLNNPILGFTHSCTAGDIDNDDDIDLIVVDIWGSNSDPAVYMLINDSNGTFTSNKLILSAFPESTWTSSELVDLNNNQSLDLVLGAAGSGAESIVLWNPGNGSYGDDLTVLPTDDAYPITTDILPFEMNNDGLLDLVIARTTEDPFYEGRSYQVLLNDGNNSFLADTEERFIFRNHSSQWIMRMEQIDIDLDGDQDIISLYDLAESARTKESIWLNDGDGKFSLLDLPEKLRGTMIPIDVDNDGDSDFLVLTVDYFGDEEQIQRWTTVINNTR